MPITKIEESVQLEFGSGDIEVMPGLLATDSSVGAVCFLQKQEATPIGTHTDYEPYKVAEIEETPVRMVFNKAESIDVVIRSLQEAKEFMLNGLPKASETTEHHNEVEAVSG
jgi:hypothetical protein